MLRGSLVALVTPMHKDGSIDFASLNKLVDWHIEQGTDGLVIMGTTGECATVSIEEHLQTVEAVIQYANGRIPVIAGTGSNNTHEAILLFKEAAKMGAHSALSVVPYYNKPSQEGLYYHFRAVAQSADLPLILYNVPGRTVVDMSNDTILRLAQIDNIVGVKEATGNIARALDLIKRAPKDFALYSGDDATAMPFILCGGHGVITVSGNIAPRLMSQMCAHAAKGDIQQARQCNDLLQDLHHDMFCEPSPMPAKWALEQLGLCHAFARLPIIELTENGKKQVLHAMRSAGLIQ